MIIELKISELKLNPSNPRFIKDERFEKLKKSIQDFPEMLQIRSVVIDDKNTIIGGNMRFRACKDLGYKTIPVYRAKDLSEEQKRKFVLLDNVQSG